MKIAYCDLIGGASGDMLLGALVDVGVPLDDLKQGLSGLHLQGFDLQAKKVNKSGYAATKVDVIIDDHVTERRLKDIKSILEKADLPGNAKSLSLDIIQRLGAVEAEIHNLPVDEIHLHELGSLDTIVDITGTVLGFEMLSIERIHVSQVPLGRGSVRGAHGQIPLPAPATLALLKGAPIVGSPIDAEMVTPTGAALLTGLAYEFGTMPPMHLEAVGYGAGGRDLPIPNLLRLMTGESQGKSGLINEQLTALETNIDDLNPETYTHIIERLFEAGALDVTLTSIQMKKNRPGTKLWVLCKPEDANKLLGMIFAETGTLGLRITSLERLSLPRQIITLQTEYGSIRCKMSRWQNLNRCSPEFEDCRALARQHDLPLWQIYHAAQIAAQKLGASLDN